MKQLPDKSIDFILCDPPYGLTQCEWDVKTPFAPMWEQYNRIIKDNGAIAIFSMQPFTSELVTSNPKMFRYEWIWEKKNAKGHMNAKKMPMRAHENICIFYKKLPTYNPQKTKGHKRKVSHAKYNNAGDIYGKEDRDTYYDSTERYPRDVITISGGNQVGKLHKTQKPVELMEYFVLTYTNPGDIVLDDCIGSGTTAEACLRTGRQFIGMEKDRGIWETAIKRIEPYFTKGATNA